MRNRRFCAEDNYIQICLEGVAEIDTTKLSRFHADDWSVRVAYFFEIANKHKMEFEFKPTHFRILDQDDSKVSIERFIFYHELRLPDGWMAWDSVPPNETVKLFVIPEDQIGNQKPKSIEYKQKLAEAWYESIKSDPNKHITDYTGKHIDVKITPSPTDWNQIKMNMQ